MSLVTEYVVDRLETVQSNQPTDHPLKIHHNEETGQGSDREVSGSLDAANRIIVSAVDTVGQEAYGPSYKQRETDLVEVRVEGLDWQKGGHVDPSGTNGVRWTSSLDANREIDEPGLVRQIKQQIMVDRTFPDVYSCYGARQITIETDTSQNSQFTDHYRHDFQFGFDRVEKFGTA